MKRGRPAYSSARLMGIYITVELERARLRTPAKLASVRKACESLHARGARFHGTVDEKGNEHFSLLSASALRVAYYRANRHHPRPISVVEFCKRVTGNAGIAQWDAFAMLRRWGVPVRRVASRYCVDPGYLPSAKAELDLEQHTTRG